MIIQSGSAAMKSQHSYESKTAINQSTSQYIVGDSGGGLFGKATLHFDGEKQKKKQNSPGQSAEDVKNRFQQSQNVRGMEVKDAMESYKKLQDETLRFLMQALFGKDLPDDGAQKQPSSALNGPAAGIVCGTTTTTTCYQESESTSFSATGTVITGDGRELTFSVGVEMSRSFEQYTHSTSSFMKAVNFCDPLVINLNTNSANVTDQKFYFDLDADGHDELISNLAAGSGFLALDKNGDGKINDGNELFGVKSGDGFKDLAQYDSDGNGWIDEADEIFDKLLIWTKDSSGRDVLCGLGKAGVGAIYLGNVNTEFSLKSDSDHSTNAAIRKTGLFLYESGGAGTIQHVDFAN